MTDAAEHNTMGAPINWRSYYESQADVSEPGPGGDPYADHRCRSVWNVLPRRPIESILDVGCGDGYFCKWIQSRTGAERVLGVDTSAKRVRKARGLYPGITFLAGSLSGLPFEDNAFQLVTCMEVLEHLDDPVAALRELGRVASRYVAVTVPDRRPVQTMLCPHCLKTFPASGHLHRFDSANLRSAVSQAGLAVCKSKIYHAVQTMHLNPIWRWPKRMAATVARLANPRARGKYIACLAAKQVDARQGRNRSDPQTG